MTPKKYSGQRSKKCFEDDLNLWHCVLQNVSENTSNTCIYTTAVLEIKCSKYFFNAFKLYLVFLIKGWFNHSSLECFCTGNAQSMTKEMSLGTVSNARHIIFCFSVS